MGFGGGAIEYSFRRFIRVGREAFADVQTMELAYDRQVRNAAPVRPRPCAPARATRDR